jgi:hypothetical protein
MGLFAAKQRENQPVMASKTDEQIAKENRLRLFRQDGARAMEDAADEAVVVRKNMERLRELRLAQEAEAASTGQTAPQLSSRNRRSRACLTSIGTGRRF